MAEVNLVVLWPVILGVLRICLQGEVSEKLAKRLERFVKLYRKGAKAKKEPSTGERGSRMAYRSIYSKIKRIGEQSGIGKLHPHMLRHTYATRLYNVEKDLGFVQDQVGHASPTTTAIYAKTNNTARKRRVEALDEDVRLALSMSEFRGFLV